ncbi:MAG: hypothetical protein SGBAC_005808 [Bacillariaceae sp.]
MPFLAAVKKGFDHRSNSSDTSTDKKGGIRKRIKLRLRIPNNEQHLDNMNNNNKNKNAPTSPATQYIPSGMTLKEYNQLKQTELDAESAKNYGAWGPRFARSSRPNGDWMAMPQLWTQGAVDGPMLNTNNNTGKNGEPSRLQGFVQKIPALILATVLFDSVVTAVTMYKTATAEPWTRFDMIRVAVCRLSPSFLINCSPIKWKQWALMNFTKMHAAKAFVVLLSAPFVDRYLLVPVNRYRLWSKRRTVTLSTLGSLGVLGVWALFLGTLKRVGMV